MFLLDESTPLAYTSFIVFFETPVFTKQIQELMEDSDYVKLQAALCKRPSAGNLIPGTGGLRKIRWASTGQGKKGGARIIYYWLSKKDQIYMLFAYPKNKQIDLTTEQKKLLSILVERELGDE